jgi:DNA polymerase (family 10)
MPVLNTDIAAILNELADLLEIQGENPFNIRAYRNAARTVNGLSGSVPDMVRCGDDLTRLPGIGKALAAKINEIATTGKLRKLEEVRNRGSMP